MLKLSNEFSVTFARAEKDGFQNWVTYMALKIRKHFQAEYIEFKSCCLTDHSCSTTDSMCSNIAVILIEQSHIHIYLNVHNFSDVLNLAILAFWYFR